MATSTVAFSSRDQQATCKSPSLSCHGLPADAHSECLFIETPMTRYDRSMIHLLFHKKKDDIHISWMETHSFNITRNSGMEFYLTSVIKHSETVVH